MGRREIEAVRGANRQRDAAQAESKRLRALVHAVHDLIHQGRIDDAHETLHCESCHTAERALNRGALLNQNITTDDADRLAAFIDAFNELCGEHRANACAVVVLESATKRGHVSVQMGGSVNAIGVVRRMMGLPPTNAIGGGE